MRRSNNIQEKLVGGSTEDIERMTELRNKASSTSIRTSRFPEPTEDSRKGCVYKQRFEKLQLSFEALNAENGQLKDENVDLKLCISHFDERKTFLENEIMRLAGALQAKISAIASLELCGQCGRIDASRQTLLEEQRESLRCQFLPLYKGNYERERKSCEKLREEIKMYSKKLEDADKDNKWLTSQLLAKSEREIQTESVSRGNRASTSVNCVRFIQPCHPVDELWKLE